jgi:hypothetical protein
MRILVAQEWRKLDDGTMQKVRDVEVDRDPAEVKAERLAALRAEAWAEVEAALDPREQTALLTTAVGLLCEAVFLGRQPDAEAVGDLLHALQAVSAPLERWQEVEAAVAAADTYEAIQAVKRPTTAAIPPVRAADIAAKAARGRQ